MDELLTPAAANREAWRCLQCWDAPCTAACPVHIPIPEFIARLRGDDTVGAEALVREANPLASSCGEICPDEDYCSRACVLSDIEGSIRVRELHRYVTKTVTAPWTTWKAWISKTIAIVGTGPAGLACARELSRRGYPVTVFERDSARGGILRYALAVDRFPDETLDKDLRIFDECPIEWRYGEEVTSLKSLLDAYDAVFYGAGRYRDLSLGLENEDGLTIPALTFLRSWRLGKEKSLKGQRVIVVGGGNVSLDVASTAVFGGAEDVVIVYRRGPQEMPVWKRELEHVMERGVRFEFCARPIGLIAKQGHLAAVQCRRTALVDTGERRRSPLDQEGYDFLLPADLVVVSVGMAARKDEDVDLGWKDKAYLPVDECMQTKTDRLFAGGDIVSGEGTVVAAASHGIRAAKAIDAMFKGAQP
jgi:dihydropyrimidine dehydrogenase (NAD+) subunit PreT